MKIAGVDKLIQTLGTFYFSEFRILRKFCFTVEADSQAQVQIVLESEDRPKNYKLELEFNGVTDLRLKDFGGGETRIIGFDIEEIANRQWDKINWKVLDFEHDSIEFLCRSVRVISLTEVDSDKEEDARVKS
jgi:hypothetical protein